ncbi:hypothetical protein ABZP36_016090 [Zizania latifolia]
MAWPAGVFADRQQTEPAVAEAVIKNTVADSTPVAAMDVEILIGCMASYKLLGTIGEGACGIVLKARHLPSRETVAIKIAHNDDDGALMREAKILTACVGNPAIVKLREMARQPKSGKLCLVMEYVGPSLAEFLTFRLNSQGRTLSELETRSVMRQLLKGVKQMHDQGVFHRDIKPGNILIGAIDGRVKICDFGFGKSTAMPPPHTQQVGTLWYMSPEQYLGHKVYGPEIDMWALGCVMAELVTGDALFPGDNEFHQLVVVAGLLGVPDEVTGLDLGVTKGSQLREIVPEDKLSNAGFDVLSGFLQFVAADRLSAATALEMPWFSMELS